MSGENLIEVHNLRRTYRTEEGIFKRVKKEVEALRGLTFSIRKGEIFGLLGPNGAGKTTTIKILTTMLTPTSGEARILGLDPVTQYKELRSRINFILGGERNLYWRLSAYDNLAYFADLYKVPRSIQKDRIRELLELVGLQEVAHRRVETFSKGMKQKLQIARGLINDPEILFLDEPTIGLDPMSARQLRTILRQLQEQGTTILLTTHYMFEADELCDRIAFIDKGALLALNTPTQLKRSIAQISIIECKLVGMNEADYENLAKLEHVLNIQQKQLDYSVQLRIQTTSPEALIPQIYQAVHPNGISDLMISKPTLEDAYIQLLGGNAS